MDQYEFIIVIFRSISLLFIAMGLMLILLSFFEIQGFKLAFFEIDKFKLSSEREKYYARAIGIAFFSVGCLIGFLPTTADVSGTVIFNSASANGALVTLNGITKKVCDDGSFSFSDIPKNVTEIEYYYKGITHKEPISIPPYWAIFDFPKSCNFTFPTLTIEGCVTDELGRKIPDMKIYIWPLSAKVPFSNYTDTNGIYILNNIPCENPIKVSVFGKERDNSPKKFLEKTIYFTDNDIALKWKRIDICTKRSIDVNGTVMCFYEGVNNSPSVVIGAIINIGDRLNYTDNKGKYLLKSVPIDTINYNITMISGIQKSNTIIPPLSYESENEKTQTTRDIYFYLNDS
jgi:hypothetical protein